MSDLATHLNFTADLDRGVQLTELKPALLSGDVMAHRFVVDCLRNGEPVPLADATAQGYFIRADETTVLIPGTTAGSAAVVTLPADCYAVPGRFALVIRVTQGGVVNTVLWTQGSIGRATTATVTDPAAVLPTPEQMLAIVQRAEAAAAAADDSAQRAEAVVADLSNSVSQLSEEMDDCANLKKSNLYNKNDLVAGYYLYTGEVVDSQNFSHTPKIYIKGNDTITYKGLTVLGTDPRHIWWDENGAYLRSFMPQKDGEYAVTVPHDVAYVSFSIRKNDYDTFECLAYHPLVKTVNDLAAREKFDIDSSILLSGYIYEQFGAEVIRTVDGYSYTPILPVKSGATLVLDTITPIAYQYMLLYDSGNNLIGTIPSQYTDMVRRLEVFNIPTNCTGIRFNVSNSQIDNLGGYYDCIREFTAVTRHKPIISFVDDDTSSVELVQRYYNACVSAGVKGNFAVQTMELTNQSGLADLLLEYEEKGFGMLYHCHSQIPAYNVGDTRDIVAAEQNFVRGLRDMKRNGFCNYKYWITPYGVHDDAIKQLAVRHGMKCLASAANWEFNLPTNGDRYFIKRADIPADDSGAHTLDDLKALIDSAATKNAWVICTTHLNTWPADADDTRIKQIADYASSKGFECMTFAEAFDIYEGAYRLYEMI